ncbi:methyltransferase [Amycolatopsis suaedae]|uniref:Methyltransferase n=1 Tax=Amycolatopsis suaedae TaxID=2510978 RepID=A0A4Q7J2T6_9PSEU|nr:methyltransferase [Amycolatopsis suaedae]RZQ61078.1 methyltransferase [Amycolatopsis suaedae]
MSVVPAGSDVQSVARLTEMADYTVPFALRAVCDLAVADHLGDGPVPVADLARATGTHARSLLRVLRALACRGVFSEVEPEVFALTPLAEPLRSDHPRSLRAAYPLLAPDIQAWARFDHSVRTGAAAFDAAHGTDYWSYLQRHPADSARFDASQRAVTAREIKVLLPAYDWGCFGTLVDVGGGNGAFLSAVLQRHPDLRGVLFDQPHVVSGAGPVLHERGVTARCTVVGGDFLTAVPPGGDGYLIKRALYDLGDGDAEAVLTAIRAAIRPGGRLLIVEPVVEPGDEFDWGKLYDLLLLTMRGGGSRTEGQHRELLAATGFELLRVIRTKSLPIVEARAV